MLPNRPVYDEEHALLRDSVRRFAAARIEPRFQEWEKAGIVPRTAWRKMGEKGFLCTSVPSEYGGMGGDFLYSVIVAEEMAGTRAVDRHAFPPIAAPGSDM